VTLVESTPGGPEGIVWIHAGTPDFAANGTLISPHDLSEVDACLADSYGAPYACVPFITGLGHTEGATIDPVSGDYLFSTFGAPNQIAVVSDFGTPTPEPSAAEFVGLGLMGLYLLRRHHRRTYKAGPAGGG
jgi:hypothetical protein